MTHAGRLAGKILAVAGGGGIGDEIARRYAAQGATVYLGDLDVTAAEATAERLQQEGLDVSALELDGSDQASVGAFFDRIEEAHGGLDGVHVNFASFVDAALQVNVLDLPIATYDEVMRVNARGYVLCTQFAVPLLIRRGGGAIVYTSSGAAYDGAPSRTAYAMSKEAGHALMRHVATAFGGQGVRANTIAPGYIFTERLLVLGDDLKALALSEAAYKGRLGNPRDIAAMSELLMSDDGALITGQVISVDAGVTMRA